MIAIAVAALLLLPMVVFRGGTLRWYLALDATTWLMAWLVWRRAPEIDLYSFLICVAVLKLASFSVLLANGRNVVWSANRAAVIAGLVYFAAIPAMLRTPIDGDEPFYLLMTESMVHDRDLDLANQYQALERTASGRTDLVPQFGDPVGPRGERYSRHEPFLALLMAPGYLAAGLAGAIATIAIFGVLLARSTVRWMEDEGIAAQQIRAVFPFLAFGPPVLFYATRIWPEVPAAFFFVEALRGLRENRIKRWLPALAGLVLLKLRFILVAIGLIAAIAIRHRRPARLILVVVIIAAIPLGVMWIVSGSPTSVHSWGEVLPAPAERYVTGFFGLLGDGMSGLAFQGPFYLIGLYALFRWKSVPEGFRAGMLAGALYVIYLLPRPEWFGGWAPPLRYLVFLMPVLALGAAAVWERTSRGAIAIIAVWTVCLLAHGLAYPWRLFHIANGENWIGEALSTAYRADFSRLFPSFIRMNEAAWIGVLVVIFLIALGLRRPDRRWGAGAEMLPVAIFSLALAEGFTHARRPAGTVELEDAHVVHQGGELFPELYAIARVFYRGGWLLREGDSLSFLARAGTWRVEYITDLPASIEIGGTIYQLTPSSQYQSVRVSIPATGRVTIRCSRGSVNLDRMSHE